MEHITSKITDPEELFPRVIPENHLSRAVMIDIAVGSVWFTKLITLETRRSSKFKSSRSKVWLSYPGAFQERKHRKDVSANFIEHHIFSANKVHGDLLNLLVDSGANINQVSRFGIIELGPARYQNADLCS